MKIKSIKKVDGEWLITLENGVNYPLNDYDGNTRVSLTLVVHEMNDLEEINQHFQDGFEFYQVAKAIMKKIPDLRLNSYEDDHEIFLEIIMEEDQIPQLLK